MAGLKSHAVRSDGRPYVSNAPVKARAFGNSLLQLGVRGWRRDPAALAAVGRGLVSVE